MNPNSTPPTQEELEQKVAFYEKRMNDPYMNGSSYAKYWRDKAETMYWHYLDLATRGSTKWE